MTCILLLIHSIKDIEDEITDGTCRGEHICKRRRREHISKRRLCPLMQRVEENT